MINDFFFAGASRRVVIEAAPLLEIQNRRAYPEIQELGHELSTINSIQYIELVILHRKKSTRNEASRTARISLGTQL